MRRLLFLLSLSIIPLLGFSQWEPLNHPILNGGDGSQFVQVTNDIFVIKNNDGVLYFTKDQGLTWNTNQSQAVAINLYAPKKILGFKERLFVLGRDLIYSDDGGDSWVTIENSKYGGAAAIIIFSYKDDIVLRIVNGNFKKSSNRGATWVDAPEITEELIQAADSSFYYSVEFNQFTPFDHPNVLANVPVIFPFNQFTQLFTATDSHLISFKYDSDSLWKYNFYTGTSEFINYDWGFQGKFRSVFSSNGNIYLNISDFNGGREEYRFYVSTNKGLTYQRQAQFQTQSEELINVFKVDSGEISLGASGVVHTDENGFPEIRNSGLSIDYVPLVVMDDRIIAARPNDKIWYSDDEGESWLPSEGFNVSDINRFSFLTKAGKYLYAVTKSLRFRYDKVYVSKDSGETWIDIFFPGNRQFNVTGVAGNDIFLSIYDFSKGGNVYYKSGNGGTFWEEITDNLPFLDNGIWSFFGGSPNHYIYAAQNPEMGVLKYQSTKNTYDFADNGLGNGNFSFRAGDADKGDTVLVMVEFSPTFGNTPVVYARKNGEWIPKTVPSNIKAPFNEFNISPEIYISKGIWFLKVSVLNPETENIERQLYVSADKGENFTPYLNNLKPLEVQYNRFEVMHLGVTKNTIFGSFGNYGIFKHPKPDFVASADDKQALQPLIYPNPAKDFVIIPADNEGYELYNITGQLIRESVQKNTQRIDLGNLPPGIYLVKSKGQSPFSSKIIKD